MKITYTNGIIDEAWNYDAVISKIRKQYPDAIAFQDGMEVYSNCDIAYHSASDILVYSNYALFLNNPITNIIATISWD